MNLIESLCVKDRTIRNIEYHLKRMRESGLSLSSSDLEVLFERSTSHIIPLVTYKMRIEYSSQGILYTESSPYSRRAIRQLYVVDIDSSFSYSKKWADRSYLDELKRGHPEIEKELILVQNHCITDSTFSNLCFWNARLNEWHTPSSFLLNGTMRQYAIDHHLCREKEIRDTDLWDYSYVSLINAMNSIGDLILPISAITIPNNPTQLWT